VWGNEGHVATTYACGLSGVLVGFLFALIDRTLDNHSMTFPSGSLVLLLLFALYQSYGNGKTI